MAASSADIEEFLTGPLVTWLSTCVKKPESLHVFETFYDGSPIIEVLLQIDPEPALPVPTLSNLQSLSITASRIKIFHSIVCNIKAIYEDELSQVVIALPDCVAIGRAPNSEEALKHLKLMILLLLGCAVQGPTKEIFITRIKELSLEAQHDIVECIKQVTDNQTIVLTLDWPDQTLERIYTHLRSLNTERDVLFRQWVEDLGQEVAPVAAPVIAPGTDGFESNHLAVELADWKARLRKQRQELEEKSELLTECKEELEHVNSLVAKLKTENADLLAEARKAKAYRDEVDAMRERAERADRLEAEAQRYRERLADTDFYRVRVAELREDNRVLLETREMLEAQLVRARQRSDHVLELEAELLLAKQNINEITLERDADRERMQELIDENITLQQVAKAIMQESSLISAAGADSEQEESNSGDNSLSEQLTTNAQARALKLELENKKLLSTIDSMKESSFMESSKKVLELEKEKKRLELKLEQVQESFDRLRQQNRELDELFKESIQENRKLQSSIDSNKVVSDRLAQDIQNERIKIEELEKNIDSLTKEKQRVQILSETIKKRADDAEKTVTQLTEQIDAVQEAAAKSREYKNQVDELSERINQLEKENANTQRDVTKFKETVEAKDRLLDEEATRTERLGKELLKLQKDNETLCGQNEKLLENEQKLKELESQTAISVATIDTLQKDLVTEKLTNEKCRKVLEKFGLSSEVLDRDINSLLEGSNPDLTAFAVQIKGSSTDATQQEQNNELLKKIEELQNENAKLQVDTSTLTSTINTLQTQQTALQLANSQLVAEKEDLCKMNETQVAKHDTLLLDQVTIRTLHEQLTAEYEDLLKEQDQLKKHNRDLRNEIRSLKETTVSLEKKITALELEKEALKNESKTLSNLRTEHSKLKDDFRNLFTANERLKTEYKGLQEENKSLKSESWRLRMENTKVEGELNTHNDTLGKLQLENAKLGHRCDTLLEMNSTLDSDRRALMDSVSKLLSQYHSLLNHSLEDKQHYHLEEKLFTDKLNHVYRQKEKLEEKIMEFYRKLDNASVKKRSLGATIARRVRRATESIPKFSSRNRRSWHEDTVRLTQSGDSAGNDSDSTEDKPNESFKRVPTVTKRDEVVRRSQRDLSSQRNSISGDSTTGPLSLGSVGTRRTVYLSEDDPNAPTPNNVSATACTSAPPLLVYNKISTVIGGQSQSPRPPANDEPNNQNRKPAAPAPASNSSNADNNTKENAIWYEYGCV